MQLFDHVSLDRKMNSINGETGEFFLLFEVEWSRGRNIFQTQRFFHLSTTLPPGGHQDSTSENYVHVYLFWWHGYRTCVCTPPMNIQWRGLDRFHPRKISIPRIIIITRSRWWEWKEGAKERGRGGQKQRRHRVTSLTCRRSNSVIPFSWNVGKERSLSRGTKRPTNRGNRLFFLEILRSAADLRIDREY